MKKSIVRLFSAVASLMILASCGSADADIVSGSSASKASSKSSYFNSRSTNSKRTYVSSEDTSTDDTESDPASTASVSSVSSKVTSNVASKSSSKASTSSVYTPLPYEHYSGTRDPFYWPFSDGSIWNMPIGSNAKLQKAEFKDAKNMSIDDEYIVKVPQGSPYVDVYKPSSKQARWPGKGNSVGQIQIPANFLLADCSNGNTPNNCTAFLMPDGRTIKQMQPCCRTDVTAMRIVGNLYKGEIDIYGEGIGGTHYGSGLSAIGGSIRKGELTSDEPIKHALKLNVYAHQYIYYDSKGYVWPADRNDSYAANDTTGKGREYGGTNPKLRMGSLLTIPKNITEQSLGLTTEVGKKLFYALQNYGCYISDDSAWDCYCWCAEDGVRDEVQKKYGYALKTNSGKLKNAYYNDALKLITNLYIVTNNSAKSVGGGGTPCKPLAPAFK